MLLCRLLVLQLCCLVLLLCTVNVNCEWRNGDGDGDHGVVKCECAMVDGE